MQLGGFGRAPDAAKDWIATTLEVSDRESRKQFRRLRRIRRDVRGGRRDLPDPAPLPIRLRVLGGEPFYVRPGTSDIDVVWEALIRRRTGPPGEVGNPRVIVDLGANVGATMAYAASRFPDARIIGVELDHSNALLCRRNVAPWEDRCVVVESAVWSSDGEVSYLSEPGREWSHRVVDGHPDDGHLHRARAISIDSLVRDLGEPQVDYLKMDIEGSEQECSAKGPRGRHESDASKWRCIGATRSRNASATFERSVFTSGLLRRQERGSRFYWGRADGQMVLRPAHAVAVGDSVPAGRTHNDGTVVDENRADELAAAGISRRRFPHTPMPRAKRPRPSSA